MFVSIHIPKTAGTALAKIFDDTSLRKIMYDYGTERDLVKVRSCLPQIEEHKDFIVSYFEYLHGHFHYLKYAEVFQNCPFITMLRSPVERVISQYEHIMRGGDPNNERHRKIMSGEMDIVDFSKIKFIGNAQWFYLEGRDIKDYDFVFIQEDLDNDIRRFAQKFNKSEIIEYLGWFNGVPSVNAKPKSKFRRQESIVSRSQKKEILKYCDRDLELYARAKEIVY